MTTPPSIELGAAELEVLKTLWKHGPATVREVRDRLRRKGRKLAYTTVLTFLSRLEKKGCVRSDRSGQAYVYHPLVQREQVVQSRLRQTVKQLFDGAAAPMVAHLMQTERFTAEEIAQLQQLVEELARKQRTTGRKGPRGDRKN